jgi:hypothetical protein
MRVHGSFVRTILAEPPFSEWIAKRGFRLEGFEMLGRLDLRGQIVHGNVTFVNFLFDYPLEMSSATIDGSLSFQSGTTAGIFLGDAHVTGALLLTRIAHITRAKDCNTESVRANGSAIDGGVKIFGSSIPWINFYHARIGRDVLISGLKGNTLSFPEASVGGNVRLDSIELLPGRPGYKFCSDGRLNLFGIQTTTDVELWDSQIWGAMVATDAVIGGSLILGDTFFQGNVYLQNARVDRELLFEATDSKRNGRAAHHWSSSSMLSLDSASINRIDAPKNEIAWPSYIELGNLHFNTFARKKSENPEPATQWSSELPAAIWFPLWLSKSVGDIYNPQPYEQVKDYLTKTGDLEAATAVGIAGKNRERRQACHNGPVLNCIFLWLSYATIGYGYVLYRSILWSLFFIATGALVFRQTQEARDSHMPFGLAYSFDTFIPLIKLRDLHYKIDITSNARYYFYVHKLAGWVLGSFIVAAVTGLTK